MKLKHEDNIVLSNTQNERRFTINPTAKAFRILSDSLYSRKIEAIIRELSCNAYDSHVMADKTDVPFDIHLPTQWEPYFSVEDFGLGLSKEDVESIYTSYFTSTKTESNDVIGALGLGSKTPFAYTDTFNIRTRKNGIELHYNAFINSFGEPSVSLISEKQTSEQNGVLITVPVRDSDFHKFKSDAEKVFAWFKVQPTTNIYIHPDRSDYDKLSEKDYHIQVSRYNSDFVIAVMGNVAYRVDSVNKTFEEHLTDSAKNFMKNNSLLVRFEIGDLDVAASRETISFDEGTRDFFLNKVNSIIDDFGAEVQGHIDNEITDVRDAINYVERQVGQWAWHVFKYKGGYLHDYRSKCLNKVLVEQIVANDLKMVDEYLDGTLLVDDQGNPRQVKESVSDVIEESFYGYKTNRHNTITLLNLRWNDRLISRIGSSSSMIILEGKAEGVHAAAKEIAKQLNYLIGVYITERKLSDETKEYMTNMLGDKFVVIDSVEYCTERNDRLKEERRLKALERKANIAKKPTLRKPRKPKNSIWVKELFDNTKGVQDRTLIDPDTYADKRIMVLRKDRSKYSFEANNTSYHFDRQYISFYLMSFKLDAIIVLANSEYDRLITKLPSIVNDEVINLWLKKEVLDHTLVYQRILGYEYCISSIDDLMTFNYDSGKLAQMAFDVLKSSCPVTEILLDIIENNRYINVPYQYNYDQPASTHIKDLIDMYRVNNETVYSEIVSQYPMLQYLNKNTPQEMVDSYIELINSKNNLQLVA
jgi:hypothetical protein